MSPLLPFSGAQKPKMRVSLLKVVIDKTFSRETVKAFVYIKPSPLVNDTLISLFISHIICLYSLQIVKRGMSQRSNLPPSLRTYDRE